MLITVRWSKDFSQIENLELSSMVKKWRKPTQQIPIISVCVCVRVCVCMRLLAAHSQHSRTQRQQLSPVEMSGI